MRKNLVIYEEAVIHILYDLAAAPFWISLYMRNVFLMSGTSYLSLNEYANAKVGTDLGLIIQYPPTQ
jgi:hypothetical protein